MHFKNANKFLSRDEVYAVVICSSVCPSVRLSVTSRSSTKTAKRIGSRKQLRHSIVQEL